MWYRHDDRQTALSLHLPGSLRASDRGRAPRAGFGRRPPDGRRGTCASGSTALWPTLIVGYAGVVIGDLLIFRLGRKLEDRVYTHKRVGKLFTPKRKAWIVEHFSKRGVLTVVIGRHTSGLRAPTFLVAGASGMATWKFLLADALSSIVTVPAVTYLVYLL